MTLTRIGQIGTRHGHAAGKWAALCSNPDVEAVAIEGRNHESLGMAAAAVEAGKHLWFDKPAGDDYAAFEDLMAAANTKKLHVQMGYMFRYSPGFGQLSDWARAGVLGDIFVIRAHMSTHVALPERREQSRHMGGILYDLGGHMLDQFVWLLGRPSRVTSHLRNDATPELPSYVDNTVSVLEFEHALAVVDIAAMEPPPVARRFEVYGSRATAILEPFDPARTVRLVLAEPFADYRPGEHVLQLPEVARQTLYERELAAFVGVVRGERPTDRSPEHELLVQETLLRATRRLS